MRHLIWIILIALCSCGSVEEVSELKDKVTELDAKVMTLENKSRKR